MNKVILSTILIATLGFTACKNEPKTQETSKTERIPPSLLADFGDQPSITISPNNSIGVVFGDKESIYFTESKNDGKSFSNPVVVGQLKELVLGYSSGPDITMTSTNIVVTAPDRTGNLYAWTKALNEDAWNGPFKINDIDKSVGESLSAVTSTPEGHLFCTWIDTRTETESHKEHAATKKKPESHKAKKNKAEDLTEMTPIGITKKELYDKIGDIPENARLAFHDDDEGNLLWVFLDANGIPLKAENLEAFKKFRERNKGRAKIKGKIYMASSTDGGRSWSKSNLVYRSPDGSVCECCKPSIKSDAEANIFVMFRNNINGSRDLHFTKSVDQGKTFSEPEKLGSGTWKINGCPMDGGGITLSNLGQLNTVWQREGQVFMANSSLDEQLIGQGRSPSISSNDNNTHIVFSAEGNIMVVDPLLSVAKKIGEGHSPKVVSLNDGAIYLWVNERGIQFKKF